MECNSKAFNMQYASNGIHTFNNTRKIDLTCETEYIHLLLIIKVLTITTQTSNNDIFGIIKHRNIDEATAGILNIEANK